MLEVNTENLLMWINQELDDMNINKTYDEKMEIVNHALEVYKNQILSLEPVTEALQVMQESTMYKIQNKI